MNWSDYSRFVGDVFGAPLAMEGLAAFFLESTFLGLWLFGWDRLSTARAPGHASGWSRSAPCCRRRSSWPRTRGCSTRSATSSTRHRAGRAQRHLGRVHQPGLPLGLRCTSCSRRWSRAPGDARASRPGTCGAAETPTLFAAVGAAGARRPACRPRILRAHRRQPARRDRDNVPADEDRRRRGAVGDLPALLVLAVPDRRRQQRRDADEDHRRSRTCCRCSPRTPGTARSSGLNELQAQYEQQYGPGNYVPNVFIQYWSMRVMAYLGGAACSCSRCGAAGCSGGESSTRPELVPAAGHLGGRAAVHHEHGRLDADRERPPALDRAGPDEDRRRRLAVGQHDRDRRSASSCSSCSTRCSRVVDLVPDAPLRAAGAREPRAEPDDAPSAPTTHRVPAADLLRRPS